MKEEKINPSRRSSGGTASELDGGRGEDYARRLETLGEINQEGLRRRSRLRGH